MSTDKRIHDDVATFLELTDRVVKLYPNASNVHIAAAVRFALDAETVVGEHYERQRLKLWDEAREVIIDGKVYKSNRNDCVPRPAEKITREQVLRCLTRAGLNAPSGGSPIIEDAVGNIMELVNGSR